MCKIMVIFTSAGLEPDDVKDECKECLYTELLSSILQRYTEDFYKNLLYLKTSFFDKEQFNISKKNSIRTLLEQVSKLGVCTTNLFLTSYFVKDLSHDELILFEKECSILRVENSVINFSVAYDNLFTIDCGFMHLISLRIK